jgi:hypothetical protein
MKMATKSPRTLAFANLSEKDGHVSFWLVRTLLPNLATCLQRHQHPSLQDFATACSQTYRGEHDKYANEHCEIKAAITRSLTMTSQNEDKDVPGANIHFNKTILEAASNALMSSENRALGKIGLEIRRIRKK